MKNNINNNENDFWIRVHFPLLNNGTSRKRNSNKQVSTSHRLSTMTSFQQLFDWHAPSYDLMAKYGISHCWRVSGMLSMPSTLSRISLLNTHQINTYHKKLQMISEVRVVLVSKIVLGRLKGFWYGFTKLARRCHVDVAKQTWCCRGQLGGG
jgi:hypothetical protein